MKFIFSFIATAVTSLICAQNSLTFSIVSVNNYSVITCVVKTISLNVVSSSSGPFTYTWTGPNFNAQTAAVTLTVPGNYSIAVSNGVTTSNSVVPISINTVIPISSLPTSTFIPPGTMTITAISPTTNITHYIYTPSSPVPLTSTAVTTIFSTSPGTHTYCLVNNLTGCSSCQNTTTGTVLSVSENQKYNLSCYPNPSSGIFKITSTDQDIITIKIYNAAGDMVKATYTLLPEITVDLSESPAGMYTLFFVSKNGIRIAVKVFRS